MTETERTGDNPQEQKPKEGEKTDSKEKESENGEGSPSKDCGNGGGGGAPPEKSKCDCMGKCDCDCNCVKEPLEGTIRRILERLRRELKVPTACEGVSKDAKTEFEKGLDECDKEYQGFDAIVTAYHDYHCAIDCELDKAKGWCEDIENLCKPLDEDAKARIEKLWQACYEDEEVDRLCCCWVPTRDEYTSLGDCLAQARAKQDLAKQDFEDLKKLYDDAKKHSDAKELTKVCAVGHEFHKVYSGLGDLILSAELCTPKKPETEEGCEPPPIKSEQHAEWLRTSLTSTLKALITAKYRTYCRYQQKLDAECARDDCKTRLDDFRANRRAQFILEANDAPVGTRTQGE